MKRIIMAYREVRNKRGQVERIAVKTAADLEKATRRRCGAPSLSMI